MTSGRPNILLIMADQLAPAFLPAYGGSFVRCPAIDAIASAGVVFENTYCSSPLCAPSRFSMLTGLHPSRIGAHDNATELPASVPTIAHHLRVAGYQTSLIGKMHFVGPDQLHGFEERLSTDIYPADFGWTPDWEHPDRRFDRWFHNMASVVEAGPADVSNQLDYDDDVGHRALRKLRDLARTDDDRPWFVTVSFTHPHDPYVARNEHWSRYEGIDVPPPTVAAPAGAELDPHSHRLLRLMEADRVEVTTEMVDRARRAYAANISYLDDWVEKLQAVLGRHGLDDDCVLIFTSDHGDMLGERGLWYKMSFFEQSVRVPLIVSSPGLVDPGRVATTVSLIDLAPTLCDLAGAEPGPTFEGFSLWPFLADGGRAASRDGAGDPDRPVVAEYLGEGAVAPMLMVRRGRWKYVTCRADPPQLFDLAADPQELDNLAVGEGRGAGGRGREAAEAEAGLRAVAEDHWDEPSVDRAVRASQRDRRLVDAALRRGRHEPWDFVPAVDAANQYMRNHLELDDVERGRRA